MTAAKYDVGDSVVDVELRDPGMVVAIVGSNDAGEMVYVVRFFSSGQDELVDESVLDIRDDLDIRS
jgi:hypothetical protein